MANGKDGSYLLRASTSNPGEYSLSVKYVCFFNGSVAKETVVSRWRGSETLSMLSNKLIKIK